MERSPRHGEHDDHHRPSIEPHVRGQTPLPGPQLRQSHGPLRKLGYLRHDVAATHAQLASTDHRSHRHNPESLLLRSERQVHTLSL